MEMSKCKTCDGTKKYFEGEKEMVCHCVTDHLYIDELLKTAPKKYGGHRPGAGRKPDLWGKRRHLSIKCSDAEFALIKGFSTRIRASILLAVAEQERKEIEYLKKSLETNVFDAKTATELKKWIDDQEAQGGGVGESGTS